MEKRKTKHGALLTTIFSIISVVYMFPILLVLMNSFKKKAYISRKPFAIPSGNVCGTGQLFPRRQTGKLF